MCTVSYVPLKGYDFVLTSNRDEAVTRANTLFPASLDTKNGKVFFPKDSLAGGTWIASSSNLTACLLNGAFKKHTRESSYRLSRGLMLLAVFDYDTVQQFISNYDFKAIEPFTLILIYKNEDVELFEIRWDGEQLYFKELVSHKPHIWASATLYTPEVIAERQAAFDTLMRHYNYSQEEIITFHSFQSDDQENGIMMDRGEKRTISITSIKSTTQEVSMCYHDLISQNTKTTVIANESAKV